MTRNAMTCLGPVCWIVTGIGLLAAGCGDSGTPERLDDQPFGCTPAETTYALDRADISAVVAQEIDLDGDGRPDDALGRAHDLVAGFAPAFDMTERFRARLATDVAWSFQIAECQGEVRVTFAPTDTALPHHAAVGTISPSGEMFAEDGTGRVPLLALADATGTAGDDAGWRGGDLLTIRAVKHGDEIDGVFALALPTRIVQAELAAPIAAFLMTQPADETMRATADANRDGVVTADEVAATTTYRGMTQADLDLTIDGEPQTSIAFAFHATAMR